MPTKRASKPRKSTARKQSKVPTTVFEIGGGIWRRQPEDVRRSIQDEVFAAHHYKCALIKIENTKRARQLAARKSLSPRLLALEAQCESLEEQLATKRSKLKTKAERTTPAQRDLLQEIEKLKAEKRQVLDELIAERTAVNQQHDWAHHWKEFEDEKKARLTAAALAAVGRTSFGPRDLRSQRIVAELYDEFLALDRPTGWKTQLEARRDAEQAVKRARNLASNNPPPGISRLSTATYLAIEKAVKQAIQDSPGYTPLKMRRFSGCGCVGVQLTQGKGAPIANVMNGKCDRLSIEILESVHARKSKSDEFHPSHSRPFDRHAEQRRRRAELYAREPDRRPYRKIVKATLKLRGTTPKDIVKIEVQGVLHRPIPEDAIVKWAYIHLDRVGYDYHFRLLLTIESHIAAPARLRPNTGKRLAINLGWRVEDDDRVRIATTWDGERHQHVYLDGDDPPTTAMKTKRRRVEVLLGHADDKFNSGISVMREWLTQLELAEVDRMLPHVVGALPRHSQRDDMTVGDVTSLMSRWRDHRKLMRVFTALRMHGGYIDEQLTVTLWRRWQQHRLAQSPKLDLFPKSLAEVREWLSGEGVMSLDAAVVFYGVVWRRKIIHLTDMARNEQTRLGRRILDTFRKLAYRWAREYDECAIEDWDKSHTAKTPKYEEDRRTVQEENANAIRQFVGISRLAVALRSAFARDLHAQDSVGISSEHFGCGGHAIPRLDVNKPGLSPTPLLQCDRCLRWYDQDVIAARHLWSRAFETPRTNHENGESLGTPASPGTARARKTTQKNSLDVEDAAQ